MKNYRLLIKTKTEKLNEAQSSLSVLIFFSLDFFSSMEFPAFIVVNVIINHPIMNRMINSILSENKNQGR